MSRVDEKERRHLFHQSLRHAEEDDEHQSYPYLFLGKERAEGMRKLVSDGFEVDKWALGIFFGTRQYTVMPKPQQQKQPSDTKESQTPRVGDAVAKYHLQIAGYHHEYALGEDRGQAVKQRADTHERSLLMGIKAKHIEAVGRDAVAGTRKGDHPEEEQRALQPKRGRYREGYSAEGSAQEHFRQHDPPAFGFHHIDERTPYRFQYPRQIEPRGIEGDLGIAQSQLFIEDHR